MRTVSVEQRAGAHFRVLADADAPLAELDGEPVGAVLRVPAHGELRANFASGGSAAASAITARDREICRRLAPDLRANGLWFVGIDVIGGRLTEVNVTSPTGLVEIDRLTGESLEARVIDFALTRAAGGRAATGPATAAARVG